FSPNASSSSAMCFETAGWLMRSFAAAAENDRCRAKAAKARNRASSFITPGYTNTAIMYFFLGRPLRMVAPRSGPRPATTGDTNASVHLLGLRHATCAIRDAAGFVSRLHRRAAVHPHLGPVMDHAGGAAEGTQQQIPSARERSDHDRDDAAVRHH